MGIIVALFFVLLILGFPIAFILIIAAGYGVIDLCGVDPVIIIQQMFNGLNSFTLLAVPFFIIAGGIAAKGGTAKSLITVMRAVFGRFPGGLGIATVFTCAFFAAISGSSLATIVAIGSLMIPTLADEGYPYDMGVGIITSAGSLGILIPPSVPMVSMCVAMGLSVAELFSAGFVPGIFLAVVWGAYIAAQCKAKGIPGPEYQVKNKVDKKELIRAIPALLFPVIVLGSIYGGIATPTEAAALAIVYVTFIEVFYYKTTKLSELPKILGNSAAESTQMVFMLSAASVVTWLVTSLQLPATLAMLAETYIPNKFIFILALIIVLFILGCFMDTVAVILILGPMILPTLTAFGVDPIHFGILCVLCTQIGLMTPPFGMNLFVSMRVADRNMGPIVKSTMPYLILLIISTFIMAYVPQIVMFLPNLLKG